MRTVRSVLATLSVLAVAALPAVAQEGGNTDEMDAALAAGFKAGFICSPMHVNVMFASFSHIPKGR